jgi:hypothetical protein
MGEHGAAGRVALDLPDRVPEAGPLKAELQPTDVREQAPAAEVARWGSCTGHQPHRPASGAHPRGAGVLVVADPARADGVAGTHDHDTVLHVNQAQGREEVVEDLARHGRPTPAEAATPAPAPSRG